MNDSILALLAYLAQQFGGSTGWAIVSLSAGIGVTFFIVWKLAAGYGLYWASSSAVGLLQTLWLRREYARRLAV